MSSTDARLAHAPLEGERCWLPARISEVEAARQRFARFLEASGIAGLEANHWKLCLTEALVNAIEHGCHSDPEKTIQLIWYRNGERLLLEVRDPGTGPTEEQATPPRLPEDAYETHGRGLYLINQLVDRWEHWRGPQGYCLAMEKRHPGRQGASQGEDLIDETISELSTAYENLAAFYRLGESLATAQSVGDFVQQAQKDISLVVPNDGTWFAFTEEVGKHIHQLTPEYEAIHTYARLGPAQRTALREGSEFIWEEKADVSGDPALEGFPCGACCPIQAGGRVYGLITLARKEATPLTTGSLNTLRTFADIAGIAVLSALNAHERSEQAQAYRELEIAADMQSKLLPLPHIPAQPQWRLTAHRTSAREVAGDYVDAIQAPDGALYLVIVDVMGKGVSAAFLAAMFRTAFHLSLALQSTPSRLMTALNRTLTELVGGMTLFATCAIARIPPSLDSIGLVNAGHCPVIGLSGSDFWQVEASGPPLGLFPDATFTETTHPLRPGQRIILLTDGLFEWSHKGTLWGWQALCSFIRENPHLPGEALWNALNQLIEASEGIDGAPTDDRTLLIWELEETEQS